MQVRCEIDLDTRDGNYIVCFRNMSNPGQPMDLEMLKIAMSRVLRDWQGKIETDLKDTRSEAS